MAVKEAKRRCLKAYYARNTEDFSEYRKKRYYALKSKGICTVCGKTPTEGKGMCEECASRHREAKKRYRQSIKNMKEARHDI